MIVNFKTARLPRLRVQRIVMPRFLLASGFRAFHEGAFRAMWNDGLDLADEAVVRDLVTKAGGNADAVLARCAEPEVKNALRANTEEAVERGAFGAPTFFVGDELFFGNDRLDFVEEALRS